MSSAGPGVASSKLPSAPLREQAEPARSDESEVHAVVAVPVEREQRLGRRPRPGRGPRKGERRVRAARARPAHDLAVGGQDHRRFVRAAVHDRERGQAGGSGRGWFERLRGPGQRLVRRRSGRRRRRQPQEAQQRLRDLLRADADRGQVLAEGRGADQHVAEQLRRRRGARQVAGRRGLRQALELGRGQLRPGLVQPGQAVDRVVDDDAVPRPGRPPRPLQQDRQVLRPARQDFLQPPPRFRQIGLRPAPLQLLRQGEPGPHVLRIERRSAPVAGDRFLGPPAEARELAAQEGDRGAVGRQRGRGVQRGRRRLVVAHAHRGHGQIGVHGRLPRRQLARQRELVAGVAEQPDLQRRQPPVEDAHRLPVLGRARRRQARGRAREPVRRAGRRGGQTEQGRPEPAPTPRRGRPGRTRCRRRR